MSEAVLFEKREGVATVTLNRPDRLNAVNDEIRAGLREKLDDACKDDEVKVIIITGAGRGFCAGADMDGLAATSEGKSQGDQVEAEERNYAANKVKGFDGGFSYFPTLPKPIIAAINGPAAGVGFIMALLISIYLSYAIYFCMVCFAFWFGEVRALVIAYNISNIVLSGQIIPLRLFPDSVRNIINLTPLQFLVDFPVSIATANLPMNYWLPKMGMALSWCIVMTLAGRVIYRSGIRVYGGYGA